MSFLFDQRVGKYTYVYEITSYWDKEQKRTRQRRVRIGKRDPVTGEIIKQQRPLSSEYGPVYFLWHILDRLGLVEALKAAFPDVARELLLLACFQVAEEQALYLCDLWLEKIYLQQPCSLPSSRLTGLLKRVGADQRGVSEFFTTWAGQHSSDEFIVFDITSISSYSAGIDFVEWGYNRDREKLPQINLGMLYGEPHALPLMYTLYPGSVPDVKTLYNIVARLSIFKVPVVLFVLDKGFYSRANVKAMVEGLKFIIPVPINNKKVLEMLSRNRSSLVATESVSRFGKELLHCVEDSLELDDQHYRAFMYLNDQRRLQEQNRLMSYLIEAETLFQAAPAGSSEAVTIELDERYPEWRRYLRVEHQRGRPAIRRIAAAISQHVERAGILVLITNANITAQQALSYYRKKDGVEKLFDAMKHGIDRRRLRIHSRTSLEGVLFVNFLSLIAYSYIQRTLRETGLSKDLTVREVFHTLRKLSVVQYGSGTPLVTEVTKNQHTIFKAFEIPDPAAHP